MNLREANRLIVYTGLISIFIFEVLVFTTVRAWGLFGGAYMDSHGTKDAPPPDSIEDDTDPQTALDDRVMTALWGTLMVSIISFIVLYFFKEDLISKGIYRVHDAKHYIGFRGNESAATGFEFHGAA